MTDIRLALLAGLAATGAAVPTLAAQDAVTVYPASYFADGQPYSAFDMLARLPGFTLEAGDSDVRGFSGATGNVLIDGQRPTGKSESLEAILRRIPARGIVRIELIRPGAPGIDMQGRSLVANVVRVRETTTRGRMEASAAWHDSALVPRLAGELSRRSGDRLLELSASAGRTIDDEKGEGPRLWTRPDGTPQRDALYREDKGARVVEAAAGHERALLGGKLRLDATAKDPRRPGPISAKPSAGPIRRSRSWSNVRLCGRPNWADASNVP
jgi:hypothetical protein